MSLIESYKATLARLPDLVRRPDPDVIKSLFTEDFRLHVPNHPEWPVGHEGALLMFFRMSSLYPDMVLTIEDIFGEDDRVCVRWRYKGTQTGSFEGLDGDGSSFEAIGFSVYRFEGALIAEDWGVDYPLPDAHPWRTS